MHFIPNLDSVSPHLVSLMAKCGERLCPAPELVFKAFQITPLNDIKVVIIGQDPYFVPGKASGLAFGYHPSYDGPIDSSLNNIIGEVKRDVGQSLTDMTLESWAKQGVLLLNTCLTTERGIAGAHIGLGWEQEMAHFIERLQDDNGPHVYMLWGSRAQSVDKLINSDYNLILKSSHPSGMSATYGANPFIGCGHFSKANEFLTNKGKEEVEWGS